MSIAPTHRRPDMVVGAQRCDQLLLQDRFDGPTHPIAQLSLKILTELKNGCEGCATVLHGVILRTAWRR